MGKIRISNFAASFLLMGIFWLILSGHYDYFHLSLGIISVFTILLLNSKLKRQNLFDDKGSFANPRFFALFYFVPFLLWKIICCGFKIAYLVIHPRMPIKTAMLRFKTGFSGIQSKVALGNSITLTPGTITLQIEGDDFLVHSLYSQKDRGDKMDPSLVRGVAKLFGISSKPLLYEESAITSEDEY